MSDVPMTHIENASHQVRRIELPSVPSAHAGTEQSGVHIMIEGHDAPRQLLSNHTYLYSVLEDLPKMIDMRGTAEPQLIESGQSSQNDPGSLSGFVMNAQSHLSFHAIPARGSVTISFYTSVGGMDCKSLVNLLATSFALQDAEIRIQPCGQGQTPTRHLAA